MPTNTVAEPPARSGGAAEPVNTAARYRDLTRFLLKYGGKDIVERLKVGHFLSEADRNDRLEARAPELARDLEKLGPAYVKLGQILSTRSDLLPPTVLAELSRLQDNVEPMPLEAVRACVESELGRPLREIFTSFEETPIGSASLGQVHVAILRDGRRVAVKVQRPGVRELVARDMQILRDFAGWFEKRTEKGRRLRVTGIITEFESTINRELDYEIEAQNMTLLKRNLGEYEPLVVPEPIADFCTARVLTMDYVTGRKVNALGPLIALNIDGNALADTLLEAYLKQVFIDGFFHADPHPGNVFLIDSDHLALLDVGMVGRFSPSLRRKLLHMLPSIYEMDADETVELTFEIGEASEDADRSELRRRYSEILAASQSGALERIPVSRVLFDIVKAATDCGIDLPSEISTLGRTLLHLDRVGRYIAPEFDVNAGIRRHVVKFIERQMLADASPSRILKTALEAKEFAAGLPRRANRFLDALLQKKIGVRVDVVPEAHLLENLEKIANRITLGLILAALIVGASQLMQVETAFRLFGYPGFAMICFAGALLGGLALVMSIVRSDRRTRAEVKPRR